MFKTSEECRLELVSYTMGPEFEEGNEWFNAPANMLPVSAARASFGKEDKTGENPKADMKLLKFLADNRHVSVFEHNYATFLVECPIFVARQIMRHSSFSFNEMSRRYTSDNPEFWIADSWRKQSTSNKQGSTNETVDVLQDGSVLSEVYRDAMSFQLVIYNELLKDSLCREQARALLPQSLLTRFYMTGNLRSFWSFLSSRLKEDTQLETRVVARRIDEKLRDLWPEAMYALLGGQDKDV